VFVAVAQIGVVPEQLAFARHCTHLFAVVLHTGVAPVHLALLAAVHCTQAPLAAHAVRAGSLRPAQSPSPAQAWHFSPLQTGVAPLQSMADMH
jgi:hypothetical protein